MTTTYDGKKLDALGRVIAAPVQPGGALKFGCGSAEEARACEEVGVWKRMQTGISPEEESRIETELKKMREVENARDALKDALRADTGQLRQLAARQYATARPIGAPSVRDTLKIRGRNYGDFKTNAELSQRLQMILMSCSKWNSMQPFHREALMLICVKIARIMNGNENYADNYRDIAGYAQLCADILG